jgi:uncharacterized protein
MAVTRAELSADHLVPRAQSAPLNPSERIEAIDALRGLALFGVLAINLVTEFRVSIFEQFLPSSSISPPLDHAVEKFLLAAFHMKAFALFSLLFGAGLAIQFERLAGNRGRALLLVRRLTVLLTIGVTHLFLIWNGDILTEYAVAGFVTLPLLFGSRRLLTLAALTSFLFIWSCTCCLQSYLSRTRLELSNMWGTHG